MSTEVSLVTSCPQCSSLTVMCYTGRERGKLGSSQGIGGRGPIWPGLLGRSVGILWPGPAAPEITAAPISWPRAAAGPVPAPRAG